MAYNLLIIHKWYGFILRSINDDEHSIGSLSGFTWIFYLQIDVGGKVGSWSDTFRYVQKVIRVIDIQEKIPLPMTYYLEGT